jgi:hypothetical protein
MWNFVSPQYHTPGIANPLNALALRVAGRAWAGLLKNAQRLVSLVKMAPPGFWGRTTVWGGWKISKTWHCTKAPQYYCGARWQALKISSPSCASAPDISARISGSSSVIANRISDLSGSPRVVFKGYPAGSGPFLISMKVSDGACASTIPWPESRNGVSSGMGRRGPLAASTMLGNGTRRSRTPSGQGP